MLPISKSELLAFERDYALRAAKEVFSASIDGASIEKYTGNPLDLATFASYHKDDRQQVKKIAAYLRDERFFDIWVDEDDLPLGSEFVQIIESTINDRVERGGYVVVFWSSAAAESKFVENELKSAVDGMVGENDRVLFALLDNTPVPEFWDYHDKSTVQLYGDSERSLTNRMDDLVVQLYWLIYKNTRYRNM